MIARKELVIGITNNVPIYLRVVANVVLIICVQALVRMDIANKVKKGEKQIK